MDDLHPGKIEFGPSPQVNKPTILRPAGKRSLNVADEAARSMLVQLYQELEELKKRVEALEHLARK